MQQEKKQQEEIHCERETWNSEEFRIVAEFALLCVNNPENTVNGLAVLWPFIFV